MSPRRFLLFFLLMGLERRNPPPGTVLFTAFLYYSLLRFGLEFVREDARPGMLGITTFQWISLGLVVWSGLELRRRASY